MSILIAGLAVFFIPHFYSAFRARAPGRDIKERIGEGPYKGLYSLVSGLGLGLIIYGYMQAPPTGNLYVGPEWARHATMTLLLLAFILLTAAYVPGTHIKRLVKHPMLAAVILWSIGHLLIGASQQKAWLFGSFLVFGLVDFVAASLREEDEPAATNASITNDLIAIVVGGGVYAATLFWAHELLFGVAPIV